MNHMDKEKQIKELVNQYQQLKQSYNEASSRDSVNKILHEVNELSKQLLELLSEVSNLDESTQQAVNNCSTHAQFFKHTQLLEVMIDKAGLDPTLLITNYALTNIVNKEQTYEQDYVFNNLFQADSDPIQYTRQTTGHFADFGGVCHGISKMFRNAFFAQNGLQILHERLRKLVTNYYGFYRQALRAHSGMICALQPYAQINYKNFDQQQTSDSLQSDLLDLGIFLTTFVCIKAYKGTLNSLI